MMERKLIMIDEFPSGYTPQPSWRVIFVGFYVQDVDRPLSEQSFDVIDRAFLTLSLGFEQRD